MATRPWQKKYEMKLVFCGCKGTETWHNPSVEAGHLKGYTCTGCGTRKQV